MKINKIHNNIETKIGKANTKQNIYISANKYKNDVVCFTGKWHKDTRPFLERVLIVIGLCPPTSPLHKAKNEKETIKILKPVKREKELKDILLFEDINYSLPIHLARNANQTKALLEASPNQKVLIKQLLTENNEKEIPLHLAKDVEQTNVLLDASPNEEILTKQLLHKGKEKYIPLHYAKSEEQIEALLKASPDDETKIAQLTAKACDGSLPIHMVQGSKQKECLLNESPNDRIKFYQLVTLDDEHFPPADDYDDACVRTAYELATTSKQLTTSEKDRLLVTYVNYVKDPYFKEKYMTAYNKSIKKFLEHKN